MQGTITFKYSTDGGTTWSTSTAISVSRAHAWLRPETTGEQPVTMGTDRICWRGIARLALSIQCDMNQFDPLKDAAANAKFVFMNKLRCAPLIHLHHNGTADLDGFTEWASTGNTNYLVPDDAPDIEYIATDGTRLRSVEFTLTSRDGYDITP
ncbi:MAG: hypothetical protein CL946_02145 [Ectothiorhodospiraceae bacterium]|nr:hypothetical protein [Ectothiorhodospiraceae bacterium]